MVGDGGVVGFCCPAVEGEVYAQTPLGGSAPVWDSAVVGAGSRVWLVGEGLCRASCKEVRTCAHLSAHPCWASPVLVSVGSCTMITCQGCDPGTTVGGVVCSWACNHTAVSTFAGTESSPSDGGFSF